MEKILTVTQLTEGIKQILEGSFGVVWVTGEISNLRRPASGHVYCTLKDETSQVRVVAFRSAAMRMGFDLEDGMKIVCRGRVNVYPARGEYQLIIDAAEPKGLGALQMAFEQLKERLEKEGLFDPSHKRKIPFLPGAIGVVTSPSGAAVRDILNITARRFPSVDVMIAPAAVQGTDAPDEICSAIADLNVFGVDVIIVARGGGSLEDLFCFNDERVARAIYASMIPVISAVGHEIDFTIADFVADLRAPTPSAAAELVVPDRRDLLERTQRLRSRLTRACRVSLRGWKTGLNFVAERLRDPKGRIADLRMGLDDRYARLETRARLCIDTLRGILQSDISLLDTLSPLSVLKRGFGIVRLSDGTVVRDVEMLTVNDSVDVKVSSGSFTARVTTILQERDNVEKKV
ncbi:MAG: exodeoxyribonuclease VII large subunit [Deltaproteobacteria bacterium]|nr:exodeoxyribonuclease VII large subunit [Deltaproteobacteria bacterium]